MTTLPVCGRRRLGGLLFAGMLLALSRPAAAQAPPAPSKAVYTYVEQMPQLPGGGGGVAVSLAVQQRVIYPLEAVKARAEGRVFVSFTVMPTGLVEDVVVVKGFRTDCDSSVVQAVKQLPHFVPGRQAGRAVAVRFTVPVTFRLQAPTAPAPGK